MKHLHECKEIAKTPIPVDDKKGKQQNSTKPTGSVQEVQSSAAPFRGCRRRGVGWRPDTLQNGPQFPGANNTGYQQATQGGPQQQRDYLPPPQLPFRGNPPRYNLCPSAPSNYSNFQPNNCLLFPPNYASGPRERFQNGAPQYRSPLADL